MHSPEIGVLDLQGGVSEHLDHLTRLGIHGVRVKEPGHFENLAGLIIPGGESTCISRLLDSFHLTACIRAHFEKGMKIWGTCAGAILLAKNVVGGATHLGLIDITIERNSFGTQLDSFIQEASIPLIIDKPVSLTFIRAPKIYRTGEDVRVLLKIDDYIAAAENKDVLVTVFHPELTGCLHFHSYFSKKCGLTPRHKIGNKTTDSTWNTTSWTRLARVRTP